MSTLSTKINMTRMTECSNKTNNNDAMIFSYDNRPNMSRRDSHEHENMCVNTKHNKQQKKKYDNVLDDPSCEKIKTKTKKLVELFKNNGNRPNCAIIDRLYNVKKLFRRFNKLYENNNNNELNALNVSINKIDNAVQTKLNEKIVFSRSFFATYQQESVCQNNMSYNSYAPPSMSYSSYAPPSMSCSSYAPMSVCDNTLTSINL
jgi:hypothetical protein